MPGVGSDSKILVRVAGVPSSMSRIYLTDRCEELALKWLGLVIEGPWKYGIDGASMARI